MNQDPPAGLKRTPLYELHEKQQAKMVPFAGYLMPVQYPTGIRSEHQHTRNSASLFDISHMGQIVISGDDIARRLETLVPGEIEALAIMQQRYTVFTNEQGGVLDDLMVTRLPEGFFLVVNAACKEADYDYLVASLGPNCELEMLDNHALLAVQGPAAAAVLAGFAPGLEDLAFMRAAEVNIGGIDCLVHRCGYTGEDGYEISVSSEDAITLAERLLQNESLLPAGLGARDTLRLEAGLCLYGHELDETTTPVEADLAWVIAAKYRGDNPVNAAFPGAGIILSQLREGAPRYRLGLLPEGRAPVRDGAIIFDSQGRKVGIISSGGYGQTVGGPVAMGYVDADAAGDAGFQVEMRNRMHKLVRVPLPFVEHRYYKKPKN